ncbi:MAG TPA: rhomboid family intramembrane serine protease [Aggregatilineaceae bacterium]|nr:rhomboid family intramembrane serine protease [Aggregatilineaceae bacterium]
MSAALAQVERILRRIPFTLATLIVIFLVALVTNPSFGTISDVWIQRLGYAPRDLFHLRLYRLVTSVLLIANARSYAQALLTIGLVGGACEWVTGTRLLAAVFWGATLIATIAESVLIAAPLYALGSSFGEKLYVTRDIGPSASYFGCTGLACALLSKPWRWIAAGLVMAFLLSTFVLPTPVNANTPVRFMAGIAHLIGFAVGYVSRRWARQPASYGENE